MTNPVSKSKVEAKQSCVHAYNLSATRVQREEYWDSRATSLASDSGIERVSKGLRQTVSIE